MRYTRYKSPSLTNLSYHVGYKHIWTLDYDIKGVEALHAPEQFHLPLYTPPPLPAAQGPRKTGANCPCYLTLMNARGQFQQIFGSIDFVR